MKASVTLLIPTLVVIMVLGCFIFRIQLFVFSLRRGREFPLVRHATDVTDGFPCACRHRCYPMQQSCSSGKYSLIKYGTKYISTSEFSRSQLKTDCSSSFTVSPDKILPVQYSVGSKPCLFVFRGTYPSLSNTYLGPGGILDFSSLIDYNIKIYTRYQTKRVAAETDTEDAA